MTENNNDASDLTTIPVRVLIVDDDEGHAQAVADSLARIYAGEITTQIG